MKNLILVRHAKSSWNNAQLSDFDRPLNDRGNEDKRTMGTRLKARNEGVELILSSSSKRTTQTSIALAKAINYPTEAIQFQEEIYHASVATMMQHINAVSNTIDTLMLVGHNPGISLLCDYLCGSYLDFPTLGMAKITFETNNWEEVFGDTGSLIWMDYPKNNGVF